MFFGSYDSKFFCRIVPHLHSHTLLQVPFQQGLTGITTRREDRFGSGPSLHPTSPQPPPPRPPRTLSHTHTYTERQVRTFTPTLYTQGCRSNKTPVIEESNPGLFYPWLINLLKTFVTMTRSSTQGRYEFGLT